ncbi:MAG TPA: glycosyltransferase family 39 protein [Thermoanaerobaculia bacterium]|nr:glycosyltransferase family 39 protein [Thermoanaerobaculia bacterium]
MKQPPRGELWLIALFVLSAAVSPLRRELFVGDETKYAQVIREMHSSGALLLPTLDGQPFTHKPPVHFWFIAALTSLFGPYSIWPYVIPSLAAFAFLLWVMSRASREILPESNPALALFACATSLLVWGSAQTARMDVSFTALIAVGGWMLYRFFAGGDFRALHLAALALSVATLIKGPMSIVIGFVLFVIEWWRRKRIPRGNYWWAALILIAIPLLWFVPAVISGGDAYAREVLEKQLARRAMGAWVHKSPPWYYLTHAPGTLFPWFLPLVAALLSLRERALRIDGARFCASWIAAVLIPYSLMSSKLDVYMMSMVPAVAMLAGWFASTAAGRWERWGVLLHQATLALVALIGIAGLTVVSRLVKPEERALVVLPEVRGLFIVMILASIAALIFGRTLRRAFIATGMVPLAVLLYAASFMMPLLNAEASTQRLIGAIERQNVAAADVELFACPYLWGRNMPRALEQVRHVDEATLGGPAVIVTSRKHVSRIAPQLRSYRKVDEFRMIGKWFDVYRR